MIYSDIPVKLCPVGMAADISPIISILVLAHHKHSALSVKLLHIDRANGQVRPPEAGRESIGQHGSWLYVMLCTP